LICNNPNHDINCKYHNNNNLKGASSAAFQQPARGGRTAPTISFPQTEINLVHNSLKIIQFYITRNPEQFQQPQDMLQRVEKAINIISKQLPAQSQQLKGASNNICPNTKKEHLKELLKMFH